MAFKIINCDKQFDKKFFLTLYKIQKIDTQRGQLTPPKPPSKKIFLSKF